MWICDWNNSITYDIISCCSAILHFLSFRHSLGLGCARRFGGIVPASWLPVAGSPCRSLLVAGRLLAQGRSVGSAPGCRAVLSPVGSPVSSLNGRRPAVGGSELGSR